MFANGKEIIKYKADNKNVNFLSWYCLRNIADGLSDIESREVSLNKRMLIESLVMSDSIESEELIK